MCIVNNQLEPFEFAFNSIYLDLKYNEGTAILVWGRERWVWVSAGPVYMDGTRGLGIVSSATDVLELSVVRSWMKGVGGVCEMCMCLLGAV